MLKEAIGSKIGILLMSKTKLDETFSINFRGIFSQFILEEFTSPYSLNRTEHSRDLTLFVRKDIPFKLSRNINPPDNIENIFVEINIRSKIDLFQGPIAYVLFKITQSV